MGSTELIQPGVMMNLLGADDFMELINYKDWKTQVPWKVFTCICMAKKESKPMRKMGHITVTAPTLNEAKEKASR